MAPETGDWHREATSIRPSFPATFVAGRGCWLTDSRDQTFFDATSGSGAVSLGHQHPRVVQAVMDQVRLLCHTGSRVGSASRAALMQLLPTMLPFQDSAILLTATGAEAVEAALKIARAATGRRRVVAFKNSFHGKTSGALAVTSREELAAFSSVRRDEVCQASFPDSAADPGAIARALRHLSQAVNGVEGEIAAVLLEPVQITEGVFEIGPEFLKAVQGITREWGALLVVDEIYTGFGRTGRRYYSDCLEQPPDLLILGKSLGNGMPIAAIWCANVDVLWPPSFVRGSLCRRGGDA
jgi:4-aminobutyrate aminotransferase/(S)-3-amino-2-methylpropionate transaminase